MEKKKQKKPIDGSKRSLGDAIETYIKVKLNIGQGASGTAAGNPSPSIRKEKELRERGII